MLQQGQVFVLKRRGRDGEPQWAYRYRTGGRDSRRIQRGGYASEQDAIDALERELGPRPSRAADPAEPHLRRTGRRVSRPARRAAGHDRETAWLFSTASAVFGDRRLDELTSREIAEWRMNLSRGYRFEGTQAVRQVLNRAVVWGMLDFNPNALPSSAARTRAAS